MTSHLGTGESPSKDALAICSSLKMWQICDEGTSLTFFYSDIEKCWLIRVNSGHCKVNRQLLHCTSENAIAVEKTADIVLNSRSFTFSNHSSADGISKILVHTLLGR
ncbi:uncharacterized protein VICG_02124, partial [Vittaforma corneae ATCC 50505]